MTSVFEEIENLKAYYMKNVGKPPARILLGEAAARQLALELVTQKLIPGMTPEDCWKLMCSGDCKVADIEIEVVEGTA